MYNKYKTMLEDFKKEILKEISKAGVVDDYRIYKKVLAYIEEAADTVTYKTKWFRLKTGIINAINKCSGKDTRMVSRYILDIMEHIE